MFCGECGTKNKKGDLFCENCGSKLEQEKTNKPSKETKTESVKQKPSVSDNKNKTKIIIVVFLLVALGIGYKVGSDITSPEKVAEEFIDAEINKDSNKLYKYLNVKGDKTFVSKKVFNEIMKKDDYTLDINNYKVTGVDYGKGKLTAKVNFSYTTKKSSTEKTANIDLVKQKTKKYIIFDNWTIADSITNSLIIKDFSIQVPRKAKIIYSGIELKDKYLNKKESTTTKDVYVLPQVFASTTSIKATLKNGTVIEKEITPSSYSKTYKLDYDVNSITSKEKKAMISESKKVINNLYNNAILEKKYDDIKTDYPKATKSFEDKYNKFVLELTQSLNKLKSFNVKTADIYDLSLTNDGNLKVKLRLKYDYKVEYVNYNDEVKTSENSSYTYIGIVFSKEKNKYSLVDIDSLKTYFYR